MSAQHLSIWRSVVMLSEHKQRPYGDSTVSVVMQITRANFRESLPVIRQALADCHFFAFDCEMTGLTAQDSKQEYLDEVEDRYAQACLACHRKCIVSFSANIRLGFGAAVCKWWLPVCPDPIWPVSICLVTVRGAIQTTHLQLLYLPAFLRRL